MVALQHRPAGDWIEEFLVEAALVDQTHCPAAVFIAHPHQVVDGAVFVHVIAIARVDAPALAHRQHHRGVRLGQVANAVDRAARTVAPEAVADIVKAVRTGLIVETETALIHQVPSRIPQQGLGQPQPVGGLVLDFGGDIRVGEPVFRGDTADMDAPVLKVENLAQAQTQPLAAFGIVDKPAGHTDREAVGVAQAVVAGKAGIAKELTVAEIQFPGVEIRVVGLGFEIAVQVVQSRLQCL